MHGLLFALILSAVAQELRTDSGAPASLAQKAATTPSAADLATGVRTKLNTLKSDHKQRLSGISQEFTNALSRERSGIEKGTNTVKMAGDQNLQLAKQEVLTGEKDILADLPLAKKAGMNFQKVNGQVEKRVEVEDANFEKASSAVDIKWNKDVATTQAINMKKVGMLEQRSAKKLMAETKRQMKLEVASAKLMQKLERKNDKQLKKNDKKFQKLENTLQEHVGDAEVTEDSLDLMLEHAEDYLARVEESPDPKEPGLEQAQVTQEESVEEFEEWGEEHLEMLADEYTEVLEDMRYGYQDHKINAQDAVAEGQEKLDDILSRYQDKLVRLVEGLKDRNTAGLEETKTQTQVLIQGTRTMTAALLKAQEQCKKMHLYWKNEFAKVQAQESAKLQAGVVEVQDKMEAKFNELNQYITNVAAGANSDMMSKIKLVEGDAVSELNKGGNWIKNNIMAVIEQLNQLGQTSAKMAEQMENVQKGVSKADGQLITLTAVPSQMKAVMAKAISDAHSMITAGQDTSKSAAAQSNQMAYETIEGILGQLNVEGESINKESQELTEVVGASAGKAAEDLAALGKKGREDMAAVKGELSLLEIKLEDNRQLFDKTLEALKTIPPVLKMESANTVGELTDLGFDASNYKQSLAEPMNEAIRGTAAHTTDMMMGAQEKVNTALESSGQRIMDRINMLDGRATELQGSQEKMHAEKGHRQSMNEQRLQEVKKEAFQIMDGVARDFDGINATIKDSRVHMNTALNAHGADITNVTATFDTSLNKIKNEFRKLLANGLGEYGDSIARASKQMDVTLVNTKSAIQQALAGDQLAFRKNMGGAADELEQLRRYQAALKEAIMNTRGQESLEKASAGLILAGKSSSQIADLIKAMDARAHSTAEKATGMIQASNGDLDPERQALDNMVRTSLAKLQEESAEMEKAMMLKLTKVTAQLGAQGVNIRQNNDDMDRYLLGNEHGVHEQAAMLSQILAKAQGKVSDGYRTELVHLVDQQNRMFASTDRQEGQTRLTAEIAAREGAATDSDVSKAEAAVLKILSARLGSSADSDSSVVQGLVGQLADVFRTETDQSDKLGHESQILAQHLAERVDLQTQQGLQRISKFEPLIAKQEALSDKYFRDLKDVVLETHGDMERLAEHIIELAYEVKTAIEAKAHGRSVSINDMEKQILQMEEMRKYAGADALDKVIEAVKEGYEESQTITEMLNVDVKPVSRNFRSRIGQVFQDMGMSLDIDKVNSMANKTMAEEVSLREKLIKNRQGLEEMMETVNQGMHSNLTAVYHETRNLIDQVKGMDHLSMAEKEQRIRELKQEARRKTSMIMARGRSMVNQQMKAMRVIEEKGQESGTLLNRAKSLASGTFMVSDRKHIMEGMGKVEQNMEALRSKYTTPFGEASSLLEGGRYASPFESSLLEDYSATSDDPNSYRLHAPQHFANLADDVSFLRHAHISDAEDLEKQLEGLGAVMH